MQSLHHAPALGTRGNHEKAFVLVPLVLAIGIVALLGEARAALISYEAFLNGAHESPPNSSLGGRI